MSKSFKDRNPVAIAVVGLIVFTTIVVSVFYAESLPVIGGGSTRTALFAESGGLKPGNEVRVAGVKVGEVTDVTLKGRTVHVKYRTKNVWIGDQSTASIQIKTLLGQKFLAIDPLGSRELPVNEAIPLDRTTTPYDVNAALSDLSSTVDEIDMPQWGESFDALADAFRDTPDSVRETLEGLTALSKTVSSRDAELAELLAATSTVSKTLADRNDTFELLINDGDALLAELEKRRDAMRAMWKGTAELAKQIEGLVADNEKTLRPALQKLDRVSDILKRNQNNLDKSLKLLGPYFRMMASSMGNGEWLDSYVCGLFDENNLPVLDENAVRDCEPKKGGGA